MYVVNHILECVVRRAYITTWSHVHSCKGQAESIAGLEYVDIRVREEECTRTCLVYTCYKGGTSCLLMLLRDTHGNTNGHKR